MPFCPKCRTEYQDWAKVCSDCGVDLVDKLPELIKTKSKNKTKSNENPLVLIATAPNEPTARMWTEILENEGIHSMIKSPDLMASMYMPSLLSKCEIYVLSSRAENAKEILDSLTEGAEGGN